MNRRRILGLTTAVCLTLFVATVSAQEGGRPASLIDIEKAEELFKDGKLPEALEAFRAFQKKHPLSSLAANAIYFEGWCLFALDKKKDAAELFEKVIKGYPNAAVVPEAKLKRAECFRDLKEYDTALKLYREFQQQHRDHPLIPQSVLGQAWVMFKQGQYAQARDLCRAVYQRFRDDLNSRVDSLFLLGQIYTEEKNYVEARKVYEEIKGLRNNPRAGEALFLAGETMYDQKKYGEAIAYYERVQSKDTLLAGVRLQIDYVNSLRPRASVNQRPSLQAQIEKLNALSANIRAQPDLRPVALFRIANCYQELDKQHEAAIVYEYFMRLYPDHSFGERAYFGFTQALTASGQSARAEAELKKFKEKYGEKGSDFVKSAAFSSAVNKFDLGRYAEALTEFKVMLATKLDPAVAEAVEFYVAASYASSEQFAEARDEFAKFAQQRPDSKLTPDATFQLGRACFELANRTGEDKAARKDYLTQSAAHFERVRIISNRDDLLATVTFQLGYIYNFLGEYDKENYEKAAAAFKEYATKWPAEKFAAEATYQLGRNLMILERHDDAIAAYKSVVEKYPDDKLAAWSAYELASAEASAKRPDEMIAALRAYLQKFPTHEKVGDAFYAIGKHFEDRRQPAAAITAYQDLITFTANAALADEPLLNAAVAAQLRIADILEKQKNVAGAVESCEKFLTQFHTRPVAARAVTAQIASLYRNAKQFDAAYEKLALLTQQYQQTAEIRIAATTSIIDLALSQRDTLRAYGAALRLLADPEKDRLPASSYLAAANALMRNDKPGDARAVFEKALTLYPDDPRTAPTAMNGLGQAQLSSGQLAEAETTLQKVLTDFPNAPVAVEAKLGLGKIFEAGGAEGRAVEMYDFVFRASKGDPGFEASYRLGMLCYNKKDFKCALPFFSRLIFASGPLAEESVFRGAVCHAELGAVDLARRALNGFIQRYPNSQFTTEAKERLNKLPAPRPSP